MITKRWLNLLNIWSLGITKISNLIWYSMLFQELNYWCVGLRKINYCWSCVSFLKLLLFFETLTHHCRVSNSFTFIQTVVHFEKTLDLRSKFTRHLSLWPIPIVSQIKLCFFTWVRNNIRNILPTIIIWEPNLGSIFLRLMLLNLKNGSWIRNVATSVSVVWSRRPD